MRSAIICDIKEFTIHDGEGIRVTVFFKGCPLRCVWCHNPETQSFEIQENLQTKEPCGKVMTSKELADHLNQFKDVFELSNGGVTFSGGEPTCHMQFLSEVLPLIKGIHTILDTCGYCDPAVFQKYVQLFSGVFYDVKIVDNALHQKYTGQKNDQIRQNLIFLSQTKTPYHIRVPLIPDITDTDKNLNDILMLLDTLKNKPQSIDFLPYNELSGAKYASYGKQFLLKAGIKNDLTRIKNTLKSFTLKGYNVYLEGDNHVG